LLVVSQGHGATRYWLGTAGNNWSTPNNWSPTGPPQNGDDLMFTNRVSSFITNDLTGLTLRSLTFRRGFSVLGNGMTVTTGIAYDGPDVVMGFNVETLTLGASIYVDADLANTIFALNCQINLNGFDLTANSYNGASLFFQESIYGAGNVIIARGTENFFYNQHTANTFAGTTHVLNGATLHLRSFVGPAVRGTLEIDFGATTILGGDAQIDSPVLIHAGAQLLLNGHFNAFTNVQMEGGLFDSGPGGVINFFSGHLRVNAVTETARVTGALRLGQPREP
jgi:hypothetical protein